MENIVVDNSAINEEIKRLERKLRDVKGKRKNTKDAQDNLEEFAIKLDKQAKEIDRSLNETLKNITIAGEGFSIALIKEHFSKLPNVRVINFFIFTT